jgi:hypothetical protein
MNPCMTLGIKPKPGRMQLLHPHLSVRTAMAVFPVSAAFPPAAVAGRWHNRATPADCRPFHWSRHLRAAGNAIRRDLAPGLFPPPSGHPPPSGQRPPFAEPAGAANGETTGGQAPDCHTSSRPAPGPRIGVVRATLVSAGICGYSPALAFALSLVFALSRTAAGASLAGRRPVPRLFGTLHGGP